MLDGLRCLTQDVSLDEGFQVKLIQDEPAELMVSLDHVSEEHHNSSAQLEIETIVEANLGNMLIDDIEKLGTEKA